MAGFRNAGEIAAARNLGRTHWCSIRKIPSQASVAGWWVDLSMAAGNPKPNYYLGAQITATLFDGFSGIFHGDDKTPYSMFLNKLTLVTPTAGLVGMYKLLDYLMFYSSIELDNADQQDFVNVASLPRYADGEGVLPMLVATTPTAGLGTFEFDYVNTRDEAKTAPVQSLATTAANIASIITSQPATAGVGGPFLRLASGDTGCKRITAWRQIGLDGGLAAVVLVQPLTDHSILEINTSHEFEYIRQGHGMPKIEDGAYLNLIMNCAATVAAGTLSGFARFTWS